MRPLGALPAATPAGVTQAAAAAESADLASAIILRGAFGTLVAAACAPRGREGIWGAAGFVMGTLFEYYGIGGVAFFALWAKMEAGSANDSAASLAGLTPNRGRRRRRRP